MTDTRRVLTELAGLLAQAYRRALTRSLQGPTTRDKSEVYSSPGAAAGLEFLRTESPHVEAGQGRRKA